MTMSVCCLERLDPLGDNNISANLKAEILEFGVSKRYVLEIENFGDLTKKMDVLSV